LIVALGAPGHIERVEIDTNHFKGNYPDSATLEGAFAPGATTDDFLGNRVPFVPLLPTQKLRPHRRHLITKGLAKHDRLTHVRLKIYPDGGVSRLRIHGRPRLA
jgi:allantoicase